MINESIVYKIRLRGLNDFWSGTHWVHGFSGIPKVGGSGKTFTNKKLVERMFNEISKCSRYNIEFVCEIVTFSLEEISVN